jgi:hypothetical protein
MQIHTFKSFSTESSQETVKSVLTRSEINLFHVYVNSKDIFEVVLNPKMNKGFLHPLHEDLYMKWLYNYFQRCMCV